MSRHRRTPLTALLAARAGAPRLHPRVITTIVAIAATAVTGIILFNPAEKPSEIATVTGLEAARAADEGVDRSLLRILATPSPSVSPSPTVTKKPKPRVTTKTPSLPVVADCKQYTGNKLIACQLLPKYGFAYNQMIPLVQLWQKESGWNHKSYNESSGAYGIPQALPGSKMASVADDWKTNPATQIKWGLGYIKGRYGSPQKAWSFFQANNWY